MAAQTNGVAPTSTVVSCPGKVFLAGGYLVLDRQHQGFVVATPSRFFTVVKEAPHHAPGAPAQGAGEEDRFEVAVVSPQFDDGRWRYEARRVQGEWVVEEQKQEGYVLCISHRLFQRGGASKVAARTHLSRRADPFPAPCAGWHPTRLCSCRCALRSKSRAQSSRRPRSARSRSPSSARTTSTRSHEPSVSTCQNTNRRQQMLCLLYTSPSPRDS